MAEARPIDRVSVVVCNYNGEEYLGECLESILSLEAPGGCVVDEVIVVDNASEDRSLELVRTRFPQVRLLELAVNGGPCKARNAGMRAARNQWVLAVDNDAILLPDVLAKLVRAVQERDGVVAAQTRNVFAVDRARVHYDGAHFHYLGLLSLRNFYRPLAEADGEGTLPTDGLIAIAILLDRDAVLSCGGYDEDFFILFEDFDLALRLRIAGYTILSVEDAVCLHRGGTPGISFRGGEYPKIRAYYHSRNRWLLIAKNYRFRTFLACLPGILVYELVWGAFTLLKGHLGAHLQGKVAFFRMLPSVRLQRRRVQAQRRSRDRELLVGGPLTFSPELLQGRGARLAARGLDRVLGSWWRLAKWLCA